MNRRLFGALGVVVVFTLSVGSCKSDPFADVHGAPAALVTNFSYLQVAAGDSTPLRASVVDATATPLELPVTFTACTADVSVLTDTSYHAIPNTSTQVLVKGVNPSPTCVVAAGGGFKDTIKVAVVPSAFLGALSTLTPKGGDTLTINSTTLLKFDTSKVAVTFKGGAATTLSKSADAVTVLVPFGPAGPATIAGVNVTFVTNLVVTVPTKDIITPTGDLWAGDSAWATAPDWTALIPAAAASTNHAIVALTAANNKALCPEFRMGLLKATKASTGPCSIFRFTLAAPTVLRFRVDWVGGATNPDVDLSVCADSTAAAFNSTRAPCNFEGGAGATAAKPQTTAASKTYAAGTWWFVIENFAGVPSANHYVDIIRP